MASDYVFCKYIPAKGHKVNSLRVELYYSLGGMNYWTYKPDSRGYYLSVTPVESAQRNGYTTESYTIGSGVKMLIKEVNRKSAKAAAEAEVLAQPHIQELIDYICNKEGVEVINEEDA